MKIAEIIRSGKMVSEVESIKRVSDVNVGFITNDGLEDETQITVHSNLLTKSGEKELSDLFSSLAKEMNTANNKVEYITVVASADTEEELVNEL